MWNKHLFQTRKDSGQKFPYGDDVTPCIGIEPVHDAGKDEGGSYKYALYKNYAWIGYYNNTSSTSVVLPDYINGYKAMYDQNIAAAFAQQGPFEPGDLLTPSSTCTEAMIGCEIKQRLYTLSNMFSYSRLVTIQEDFIGNNVKDLNNTFLGCHYLKKAPIIPNGVVNMVWTFRYCRNMTTSPDSIPDSVITMSGCFYDCNIMTTVPTIGNKVENMYNAFYNCRNITTAPTIPNSVVDMGGSFWLCTNIKKAPDIPENVRYLYSAFRACYNITELPNIHSPIADLTNTFAGCTNLPTSVNLYRINPAINTLNGTFCYCSFSTLPEIPPYITNIPHCFCNCNQMTSVGTIPNTIVDVSYAFANCHNLTTPGTFPDSIINAAGCHENSSKLTTITIPPKATNISLMYNNCAKVVNSSISIPDSVIDMSYTFSNCKKITGISKLGNNIQNMSYAFYNADIQGTVPNIPDSVTDMSYTFCMCGNLVTPPTIGNSVVNMSRTFTSAVNMTSAPTIPNSVVDMSFIYSWCSNLKSVPSIGSNVVHLDYAFSNSGITSSPDIPDSAVNLTYTYNNCRSLTTAPNIGNGAVEMNCTFINCTGLINPPAYIGNSVVNMTNTFQFCYNLKTPPTLPNSVVNMVYCFHQCSNLQSAPAIPDNVVNMSNAFQLCTNIKTAPTLGNSVTNIAFCFDQCTNLTTVPDIPDSVINARQAFSYCYNVTTPGKIGNNVADICALYFYCNNLQSAPELPESAITVASIFANCVNLVTAPTIPSKVENMYQTFRNCTKLTGNIYVYSNVVNSVANCFNGTSLAKTLYVYPESITYNTFVAAYGSGQNGVTIKFLDHAEIAFTVSGDSYVKVGDKQVTQTYWHYDSTQTYTYYKRNYVPYVASVNVGTDETITINTDNLTPTPAPYTITYNVTPSNATITSVIDGFTVEGNSCYGYDGAVINYTISCDRYKKQQGTITVTGNETVEITLEETLVRDVFLEYPFTSDADETATLIDGSNFTTDSAYSAIISGSTSYCVNNGTSYGYLTIDAVEDVTLSIRCFVSSESSYDWGAIYVGTAIYKPTQVQVKNGTTDGNGSYLYRKSGSQSITTVTTTLAAGSVYYVTFAYVKDSSGNRNNDRFYIRDISYSTRWK